MFGTLFGSIRAGKQRRAAKKEKENALGALDNQQSQLNNMFNTEYYGDFMSRADNQSLMRNLRSQTQQQNRQAQTQAAIVGSTPEAIAAQQKNNAAMVGNTYSTIAANGANWKSGVLNNYINNTNAVHDKRYNTYMNAYNMFKNGEENASQNLYNSLSKMDDFALNVAGAAIGGAFKKKQQ